MHTFMPKSDKGMAKSNDQVSTDQKLLAHKGETKSLQSLAHNCSLPTTVW